MQSNSNFHLNYHTHPQYNYGWDVKVVAINHEDWCGISMARNSYANNAGEEMHGFNGHDHSTSIIGCLIKSCKCQRKLFGIMKERSKDYWYIVESHSLTAYNENAVLLQCTQCFQITQGNKVVCCSKLKCMLWSIVEKLRESMGRPTNRWSIYIHGWQHPTNILVNFATATGFN